MKTKNNNTETAAAATEAPQDEYEYFNMVAKKYPLQRPKLPPNEEAEYLRRIKKFRERRREAGLKIDPDTAEICMVYREGCDPYDIDPLLSREFKGGPIKTWFVRSPGSDIWIEEGDLPAATLDALREKQKTSEDFEDIPF